MGSLKIVTVGREVGYELIQHCSRCGPYTVRRTVEAVAEGQAYGGRGATSIAADLAAENATRNAYREIRTRKSKQGRATYDVVCPKCRQLTESARRYHFSRGFRSSILATATRKLVQFLLLAVVFGVVAYFSWPHYQASDIKASYRDLLDLIVDVFPSVLFWSLTGLSVLMAGIGGWYLHAGTSVAAHFSELTDRQIERLVVKAHDRNDKSLHEPFFLSHLCKVVRENSKS